MSGSAIAGADAAQKTKTPAGTLTAPTRIAGIIVLCARAGKRVPAEDRESPGGENMSRWCVSLLPSPRPELEANISDPPTQQSQEPVFAFLADPATHGGAPVKRIDTHAAAVFLAGERALKVKRAVRFPFLDYLHAREAQGRLRGRARGQPAVRARNLPRACVPITRAADGTLALGGDGTPVEWAVEMRRFDETRDARPPRRRGPDRRRARRRARPRGRGRAMRSPPPVAARAVDRGARRAMSSSNDAGSAQRPTCSPAAEVARLAEASRAALCARLRPLLDRTRPARIHPPLPWRSSSRQYRADRRPAGAVRRHRVRSADRHRRRALRSRLPAHGPGRARARAAGATSCSTAISSRRGAIEDLDALAALPLFLSLRAAIRAKVTAARLAHARPTQQPRSREARALFRPGAGRCIAPPQPVLVAVGGLSGTGKSVLARALAPNLAPVPGARGAALRRRAQGAVRQGRDANAAARSLCAGGDRAGLCRASSTRRAARVAAGHSAIVDAVFARPHGTRRGRAVAPRRWACRSHGLFLTADLATRLARVGARAARRLRRRRRGRAPAGGLRPRQSRLGADRRLRHAGGDAGARRHAIATLRPMAQGR